jgi:hypothetical protein
MYKPDLDIVSGNDTVTYKVSEIDDQGNETIVETEINP